MKDHCPNCGARRGDITPFACRHEFHNIVPYKPELMFSFRSYEPGQYSTTISESRLKQDIADARRGPLHSMEQHINLANAAERMIEMAKAPAPKAPPATLNWSEPIRPQLAKLLEGVGLDPNRFLQPRPATSFFKEPSSMCPSEPTPKHIAEQAARELATMLKNDLGVEVTPILLRLWLVERWGDVAKLAHKIHGSA